MSKSILLALIVPLGVACTAEVEGGPDAPGPAVQAPLAPELVVGSWQGGHLADLTLGADGRFRGLVLTGMTADGCGTFEGAGSSEGTWSSLDGAVTFELERESGGIALSLRGARAWPSADGLELLTSGGLVTLRRVVEVERDSATSR